MDTPQYSTLELAGNSKHDLAHRNGYSGLEVNFDHSIPEAVYSPLPQTEAKSEGGEVLPNREVGRIFGLKRTVFFVITGILSLVIVGAIVGGAVGATVGKSKKPAPPPPSQHNGTSPGPSNITIPAATSGINSTLLDGSSLASINWTDANGAAHHAVFFQDKASDILVSVWDSKNTTWGVTNIIQALPSGTANSFATLLQTPLAATSATDMNPYNFQMNLYFYDINHNIVELFSKDAQGETWAGGSLTGLFVGGPDSRLAAAWPNCGSGGCLNNPVVLYEDNLQNLKYTNGGNWKNITLVTPNIVHGSGIGLITHVSGDSTNNPNGMSVYTDQSQVLQEYLFSNEVWFDGTAIETGLPSSTPLNPEIAAMSYGTTSEGWNNYLVTSLFSNGSISSLWWDSKNWSPTAVPPTMSGTQTTNFSAIAMHSDMRFYGISAGQIIEYAITPANPLAWSYVGTVNNTVKST